MDKLSSNLDNVIKSQFSKKLKDINTNSNDGAIQDKMFKLSIKYAIELFHKLFFVDIQSLLHDHPVNELVS